MKTNLLSPASQTSQKQSGTPRSIIRSETNFLRFPFFALSTKDIHRIDFREVSGTRKINTEAGESTVDFTYRASRNTDHVFPGLLSRNIHFALLSMLAKQRGEPVNPIQFTWRQLAREMGVSYGGGKMIENMKQAIRSTHGTIIRTDQALIDGSLPNRPTMRRERGLHLYEDYVFQDEILPDGSTLDKNEITLSDWYFNNLKARYVQPVDFSLWLELNRATPIASRLYEYLVFVFGTGSFRRISYEKLAASIPLKPMKHLSKMKLQLQPALDALKKHRVLKRVVWSTGRFKNVIVELQRGESLKSASSPLVNDEAFTDESNVQIHEAFDNQNPTDRLIRLYYQKRFGTDHLVTEKERASISPFINRYGFEQLESVLPQVIRRMKHEFASGSTILAALPIIEQQIAKAITQPNVHTNDMNDRESNLIDKKQQREELEFFWESLSTEQRAEVEAVVSKRLGSSRNSQGFQLMLRHEAKRIFSES